MIKIDKNFVKKACDLVFEDLGFYSDKKYRTNFVRSSDFCDCLFKNFPFLSTCDNLLDDFLDLFFEILDSLHFNYLSSTYGNGFIVPYRMSSLKRFLFDNYNYDVYNDLVSYFSSGKIKKCYLFDLL